MNRSLFLSFIVAIVLSALACPPAYARKAPQLGVQLWSVKDDLKKDYDGTLQQLADAGVKGVEFAGYFGPYEGRLSDLKTRLDSLGIKTIGAHVKLSALTDDRIEETVSKYRQLGAYTLIVPSDPRAIKRDSVEEVAKELDRVARRLKAYGMRTGYHNHEEEMADVDGTTCWDIIATHTQQDVILQQDVGWTTFAGKDPVTYVRRYPGRTYSTHYKAKFPESTVGRTPIIGQDITDWVALYRANASVGGTRWLIVEQEEYPDGMSQIEAVKASIAGLRKALSSIKPAPKI